MIGSIFITLVFFLLGWWMYLYIRPYEGVKTYVVYHKGFLWRIFKICNGEAIHWKTVYEGDSKTEHVIHKDGVETFWKTEHMSHQNGGETTINSFTRKSGETYA